MVEAKRCARCGCMYISDTEVCGKCEKKDGADIYKLRGFLEQGYGEELTQGELAIAIGITDKNLVRFLGYDEFKGIEIGKKAVAANGKGQGEEIQELV